jgi:uncharacterized protein YutE (UPF0331/DUF86 family)
LTDRELIAKKLAQIETCVRELRSLAQPDRIRKDIREQRFVEHTLQLAIQADVASHVVSDDSTPTSRRTTRSTARSRRARIRGSSAVR